MKIEAVNEVVFSSGRQRYACAGILGIAEWQGRMVVTYGYDGVFYTQEENTQEYLPLDQLLTSADLVELSDYMIERWTKFKGQHSSEEKI